MPAPVRKKAAKKTGAAKPVAKKPAARKAAAGKAVAKKPAAGKTVAEKTAAKKPVVGKTAAKKTAVQQPAVKKPAAPTKGADAKVARKPAAPRVATRKAAAKPKAAGRPKLVPPLNGAARRDGPDPEGFFVARVRGEDAARDAPHQLLEPGGWEEEPPAPILDDEGLGELPWTYGDDLLVALPRDPTTLFVYWDQARATVDAALAGLPGARVQLWIFARGQGWERVRVAEVALEARGWYVHDLEPGRAYRAELHVVGTDGQDRVLPGPSVAAALPPRGPSPIVDDRFATLPWEVPLSRLVGPGVPGGPFGEEARALLASLSGWDRFGHSHGERPTSPARPFGGEGG
jgi:hypothetical protein